jgi:hypothetical protein
MTPDSTDLGSQLAAFIASLVEAECYAAFALPRRRPGCTSLSPEIDAIEVPSRQSFVAYIL